MQEDGVWKWIHFTLLPAIFRSLQVISICMLLVHEQLVLYGILTCYRCNDSPISYTIVKGYQETNPYIWTNVLLKLAVQSLYTARSGQKCHWITSILVGTVNMIKTQYQWLHFVNVSEDHAAYADTINHFWAVCILVYCTVTPYHDLYDPYYVQDNIYTVMVVYYLRNKLRGQWFESIRIKNKWSKKMT